MNKVKIKVLLDYLNEEFTAASLVDCSSPLVNDALNQLARIEAELNLDDEMPAKREQSPFDKLCLEIIEVFETKGYLSKITSQNQFISVVSAITELATDFKNESSNTKRMQVHIGGLMIELALLTEILDSDLTECLEIAWLEQ